jgi:hypothetical protein
MHRPTIGQILENQNKLMELGILDIVQQVRGSTVCDGRLREGE